MNSFLIYFVVSIFASVVWTIVGMGTKQLNQQSWGLGGAWAASLVLAALWQAETIPWVWQLLQAVLLIWLSAIVALVIAAARTWNEKQRLQSLLVFCALASIVVNLVAGLHFLWIATVSPAGV